MRLLEPHDGAARRHHPIGLRRCATGVDRVCVIACETATPHAERCMQSPNTRSGRVVVLEQQMVCQTWIGMVIMPCIAKPSRSSPPRLTHDLHVDHPLAIARDDRSDHGLVLTVLGQEKPGCVPLTPGLQRAIGLSPWRLDVYSVDLGRRVMRRAPRPPDWRTGPPD